MADIVAERPGLDELMLCGHQPDLSLLVGDLVGGAFVEFKKGALADLDVSSMRSPGQAKTLVENHSGRDQAVVGSRAAQTGHTTEVDWSGMIAVLLATPKVVLVVLGAVVFALFALLGPFIFLALVALVVFTGPFRSMLGAPQRQQVEDFIVRANEFIAERRRSGTGLS